MTVHIPVMLEPVLRWLQPSPGKILVDGTLGGGGHSLALRERLNPEGRLISIDRDAEAVAVAKGRPELDNAHTSLVHASYDELPEVLVPLGIEAVDGVLLDLGLSSDQLADRERGFSFALDGPLDLRFDTSTGDPAWRLLDQLPEREIADLIYRYGEERMSRRIARRIVETRRKTPLRTSGALAELVRSCVPRSKNHRIDPATRTFQALRIAVNDELEILQRALERIPRVMRPGGILAIISFHSLEDRIVKQAFRNDPRWEALTKKPELPSEVEIEQNSRSRSAKLRVARRKDALFT